ncbi:gliding motility-associated C-terminal domain-containing protein, partial [Flavobacterium johnsoniae]|uniref:gliding motility-associated C-terminal domain-containing protein n=1 Tax=Flavobacterium johnsoniae TaxID=986 RepID=UPI0010421F5F
EVTNPGNCDTVISLVNVTAPAINSKDDSASVKLGSAGTKGIIDVFENDNLDGKPAGLNIVTLTVDTPDPKGRLILNPDGTVDLAPGTPAGTYTIAYTICEILNPNNCSTSVITVVVGTVDDIDVYTHMTPNGDGINDVFYIDGIDKYPNNTVEVYNRWGVLVYKADGYNNADVSFDGKSRGRTTVDADDNLPEGTYYYVVRYTNTDGNRKDKAGFLYLNR